MRYVVGIDAGGSKTVGLLADEQGKVLAEARAGGANLHVQGEAGVAAVLDELFSELTVPSGLSAVCLGLAGVDRPAERETIFSILRRLGVKASVRVYNDALIALLAGAPERFGVVLIAGTGSIAFGMDPGGACARAGGWGHILADEGSAYWLGHAALRKGIRATDGRGPANSFGERVSRRLGLEVPAGLISWFYDQQQSRYRIAELAELVEEAANDQEEEAEELLDEAALHLARAARAVASQLSFGDAYPVVLSGGAFRACPSLVPRVEAHLGLPGAKVTLLRAEPAHGAVQVALDLLDR